VRYNSPGR